MKRFSRKLFAIHSWSGLIAGAFILIFFITGAIIVFREELNVWENPNLFRVKDEGNYLPYDKLYRMAQEQRPDLYLYSFRYIPKEKNETIEMRVYDPSRKDYPLLYLNPYNGKVLGVERNSLYDILLTLHYKFYLGRIGEFLAAIFALALLCSLITGVIVYRKFFWKALFFQVPLSFKNWRFAASGLHRIIGVWSLVFNFVLAFSGFYMMLYVFDVRSHFGATANEEIREPPKIEQNIDTLIQQSGHIIKSFHFHYLDFPRKEDDPIRVTGTSKAWLFGDYNNAVAFNYKTGSVKEVFREEQLSTKEKFEYALYTLHYGQYGGNAIKILYSFFGSASALLTISGFFLWYRKLNRRKILKL